jgi:hypothetical protein
MPAANYVATVRVTSITVGNSALIEWCAEFDVTSGAVEDTVLHIGDNVFVAGFAALNTLLAG